MTAESVLTAIHTLPRLPNLIIQPLSSLAILFALFLIHLDPLEDQHDLQRSRQSTVQHLPFRGNFQQAIS